MTTNVPEPPGWLEIAAELHSLANDVEKLADEPAPSCFQIHIQPKAWNNAAAVAAVDAIALALLGKRGKTRLMGDGVYHRDAGDNRGPIWVHTYRQVPEPHTAEIARLEARIAELRAQDEPEGGYLFGSDHKMGTHDDRGCTWPNGACVGHAPEPADPTGLLHSRADDEPDDPTPVSGARVPAHTGGVTEGGLVDETPPGPVHMAYADGGTVCGESGAQSFLWTDVTCARCIDSAVVSATA